MSTGGGGGVSETFWWLPLNKGVELLVVIVALGRLVERGVVEWSTSGPPIGGGGGGG